MTKCSGGGLYFVLSFLVTAFANSSEISGGGVSGVTLRESEFYGFGTKNSSYFIKSFESTQINENTHSLIKVEGIYSDSDKKDGFHLFADKGTYNSSQKILDLFDDIKVNFAVGYKLITDKITINFNEKTIYSKDITKIIGENEKTISKTGFKNNIKDQTIYFPGPITTILVRK